MKIKELNITHRFEFYDNIVVDENKQLWQLAHFCKSSKRTKNQRLLTFNKTRNAYRINGVWVTKSKLYNLCYKSTKTINKRHSQNF